MLKQISKWCFIIILLFAVPARATFILYISDAGNLRQMIIDYLNYVEENAAQILYDELIKQLKAALAREMGLSLGNIAAGKIQVRTELKIKTTERRIAARFDSLDTACDINELSEQVKEIPFKDSKALNKYSQQEIDNTIESLNDKDLSDEEKYNSYISRFNSIVHAQHFKPESIGHSRYVHGLSLVLRVEFANTLYEQNRVYQEKIELLSGYFQNQTKSLAKDGTDTQLKRIKLIKKSIEISSLYYQLRIKQNQNMLLALENQLILESV